MPTGTLQDINVMNEFVICRRIICAVDIHRKAMELVSVKYGEHIVIYKVIMNKYLSLL